jgi:hypothetical protein
MRLRESGGVTDAGRERSVIAPKSESEVLKCCPFPFGAPTGRLPKRPPFEALSLCNAALDKQLLLSLSNEIVSVIQTTMFVILIFGAKKPYLARFKGSKEKYFVSVNGIETVAYRSE